MVIPHKGGLPHSDTQGSTPARGFPWIFAACHVLHRLLAPRHPPDALLLLMPTRTHRRALNSKPRHAQEPSTASTANASAPRQNPHSAHTKKRLERYDWSALGAESRSRSPQHPGQTPRPTRHGPLLPVPPKRLRAQAKPAESSRASKTHQNLIHNPQRTHAPRRPAKHQARAAPGFKHQAPPNGSGPAPETQTSTHPVTPPAQPRGLARPRNHRPPGGGRDRTDDLLLAKQALSQLSYAPMPGFAAPNNTHQASPWWAREDSNLRPHAYQACALTN